ncbi:Hypothetical predicted protein [Olea europaea subsp. europaea]|uniref:Uncharacterized protein n=1 Tax=Olea europaea subsp. europaea TaxID=158383 RepID=A0A8S0UNY1_OLEEU|nr:Hypothetical predicted protein [Olea europaea subsp. europaea]
MGSLELNLQITELQLRAQPSTLPEVKEQQATPIIAAVMVVESVVGDYMQLFKISFEVLKSFHEDPNIQRLETEACELQQFYDEVKGTV